MRLLQRPRQNYLQRWHWLPSLWQPSQALRNWLRLPANVHRPQSFGARLPRFLHPEPSNAFRWHCCRDREPKHRLHWRVLRHQQRSNCHRLQPILRHQQRTGHRWRSKTCRRRLSGHRRQPRHYRRLTTVGCLPLTTHPPQLRRPRSTATIRLLKPQKRYSPEHQTRLRLRARRLPLMRHPRQSC